MTLVCALVEKLKHLGGKILSGVQGRHRPAGMQSPSPNLSSRRQTSYVASKVQLYERLSRNAAQPSRGPKQRANAGATGLDADSSSKPTTLRFKTHFQCAYGEHLKLVGNKEELGNWDVNSAPSLDWTDGDAWIGQVNLEDPTETQFKLVLLGHEGVIWEPISDRTLQKPSNSQLAVDLAWGTENLQNDSQQRGKDGAVQQSNSAAEFDLLWNPIQTAGIPRTSPLEPKQGYEKSRRSSFGVTLEPEWDILDVDDATSLSDSPSSKGSLSHPEVEKPNNDVEETEGRGLIKKKKKRRTMRSIDRMPLEPSKSMHSKVEQVLENTKHMAIGALTAATLSATGMHGVDLLMSTVGMATGAAVVPKILDAKNNNTQFNAREAIQSVAEGIGGTLLKAASILDTFCTGLNLALQKEKKSEGDAEEGEMSDLAEDEQKLGEYVAGLAQEASAFAQKYSPSEEEVFEATIACRAMDKELVKNEMYSNIVAVKKKDVETKFLVEH